MLESYAEVTVQKVLTASEAEADEAVGYAALLLAGAGRAGESDRLVRRWQAVTGKPATLLAEDPLTARAWAMLFAARGERPDWAADLPPLDLDAEEEAHRALLAKDGRELPAEAECKAAEGDLDGARSALTEWARQASVSYRPDLATLAACRHVAPLLADGVLTVPGEWANNYAGTLIAALHARYPPERTHQDWRDLIDEIMRIRGGVAPAPATHRAIADAERRLGLTLPDEYRNFLLTCDGLPADVVFPRLLPARELTHGTGGVPISEDRRIVLQPSHGEVSESDPVFGVTTHASIRALLEHHLGLLEAAQ